MQRTWSHLESIFIGSEDIRRDLPEAAAEFDKIDEEFKVWRNSITILFLLGVYSQACVATEIIFFF